VAPAPTSVLVAELFGHARLDTVRAYTLPNEDDVQAAVYHITVDYCCRSTTQTRTS
jgi:hypothetical protein